MKLSLIDEEDKVNRSVYGLPNKVYTCLIVYNFKILIYVKKFIGHLIFNRKMHRKKKKKIETDEFNTSRSSALKDIRRRNKARLFNFTKFK